MNYDGMEDIKSNLESKKRPIFIEDKFKRALKILVKYDRYPLLYNAVDEFKYANAHYKNGRNETSLEVILKRIKALFKIVYYFVIRK